MASPVGLTIGSANKPWKVGSRIGSGACGTVHELLPFAASSSSSSSPSPYVVKIAPLPKKVVKKGKKSAEQRNADLLVWESSLLNSNLVDLRGNVVPDIPFDGNPPCLEDAHGFRFLVMERMAGPLSDLVPLLVESNGIGKGIGSSVKMPLGDIAVAMLNSIQAFHDESLLFVDVKFDNFMLSGATSTCKNNKNSTLFELSRRVRLVDFGLVESFADVSCGSQRANMHPNAPLVGTPTYASLNVMNGNTVSRRDDLEALGYVLSEVVLMIASHGSASEGGDGKRKGRGGKKASSQQSSKALLPWADSKSDNELLATKTREMDESKRSSSHFFGKLKEAGADVVMGNYFSLVQKLKYKEKPDYDKLRSILKNLTVSFTKKGLSEVKNLSPNVSMRRKNKNSNQGLENEDINRIKGSPTKKQKTSEEDDCVQVFGITNTSREVATQTTVCEVATQTNDNESMEMDWESTDENKPPAQNSPQKKCALKLEILGGPHQGEVFHFGGDYPETIVIGRDPASARRSASDVTKVVLSEDSNASGTHAKLVLNSSKKSVFSVKVTDMTSSNGTFVNDKKIPSGKSLQAFISSKILIGESLFEVKQG